MTVKNTKNNFGIISKLFHWLIFLAVLTLYGTVAYKRYVLPEGADEGWFLIGEIHKPVGTIMLVLVSFAFSWHLLNTKPRLSPNNPAWEKWLALVVHKLLYVFLLTMPISGFVMSNLGGYPISFFGMFEIPLILEKNENLGDVFYQVHEYFGYFGLALIGLHLGGILKEVLIRKNNVIKKMLPF